MMARLFAAAMLLVAGSAVAARAQEDWREERHSDQKPFAAFRRSPRRP